MVIKQTFKPLSLFYVKNDSFLFFVFENKCNIDANKSDNRRECNKHSIVWHLPSTPTTPNAIHWSQREGRHECRHKLSCSEKGIICHRPSHSSWDFPRFPRTELTSSQKKEETWRVCPQRYKETRSCFENSRGSSEVLRRAKFAWKHEIPAMNFNVVPRTRKKETRTNKESAAKASLWTLGCWRFFRYHKMYEMVGKVGEWGGRTVARWGNQTLDTRPLRL